MRARALITALAVLGCLGAISAARAEEAKIRVGAIDAVLTTPADGSRNTGGRKISASRTLSRIPWRW